MVLYEALDELVLTRTSTSHLLHVHPLLVPNAAHAVEEAAGHATEIQLFMRHSLVGAPFIHRSPLLHVGVVGYRSRIELRQVAILLRHESFLSPLQTPAHLFNLIVRDHLFLAVAIFLPNLLLLNHVAKETLNVSIFGMLDVSHDDLSVAVWLLVWTLLVLCCGTTFGLHHRNNRSTLIQVRRFMVLKWVFDRRPRGDILLLLVLVMGGVMLAKTTGALTANLLLESAHMLPEVIQHDVCQSTLPQSVIFTTSLHHDALIVVDLLGALLEPARHFG